MANLDAGVFNEDTNGTFDSSRWEVLEYDRMDKDK